MTSNSVSPLSLAKKIVDLLGAGPGDSIELSKLRNGDVLISRPEQAGESEK
jgi:hypothetical protein